MIGAIFFVVVNFAILMRAVFYFRSRQIESVSVSLVASTMYLLCLFVPSYLQKDGRTVSKLVGPGVLPVPSSSEIGDLAMRWATELLVVVAVESITVWFIAARPHWRESRVPRARPAVWAACAVLLVVVGALVLQIFPSTLDDRAAAGQGAVTILKSCLVCGLAIVAYFNCFGRWWVALALLMGTIFLVAENVRSPLSVIVIAWIVGMVARRDIYRRRWLVSALAVSIVAIGVGSFMSEMRANLIRHEGANASEIMSELIADPVAAPYSAGIDTLDGYRFSEFASEREPAEPLDLLSPIYTFIPRAIWPAKPASISSTLSSKYLGYKSSGQFLSLVGYLKLATGSYSFALLVLGVTVLVLTTLVIRLAGSFWSVFVYVCIFRLFLNGSAFDVYYCLSLALVTGIALVFSKFAIDTFLQGGQAQASSASTCTQNKSSYRRYAPGWLLENSQSNGSR